MILEYAQLLSTAHRVLDGKLTTVNITRNGKTKLKRVLLLSSETADYATGEIHDPKCYNATHVNHPSAVWARTNLANYRWLFRLFSACLDEYTHRYGKVHATARLAPFLAMPPTNIPFSADRTPFALAMPDEYKDADAVVAYQNYYVGSKATMARWTNRSAPAWFAARTKDFDASTFERTR
jgi:hypothetical protein